MPGGGDHAQVPAIIKELSIDYPCPIMSWLKLEDVRACQAAQIKMWSYLSLEPYQPLLNWRLDNRLYEPRLVFWQVAQLRLYGFLYCDLNAWTHRGRRYGQ